MKRSPIDTRRALDEITKIARSGSGFIGSYYSEKDDKLHLLLLTGSYTEHLPKEINTISIEIQFQTEYPKAYSL